MFEYASKKTFTTYPATFNKKGMLQSDKSQKKIIKNLSYISKEQRPKWCVDKNNKLVPQFKCLCNGKKANHCPFFGYNNAEKKDYKTMEAAYDESMPIL